MMSDSFADSILTLSSQKASESEHEIETNGGDDE